MAAVINAFTGETVPPAILALATNGAAFAATVPLGAIPNGELAKVFLQEAAVKANPGVRLRALPPITDIEDRYPIAGSEEELNFLASLGLVIDNGDGATVKLVNHDDIFQKLYDPATGYFYTPTDPARRALVATFFKEYVFPGLHSAYKRGIAVMPASVAPAETLKAYIKEIQLALFG